VASEVKFYLDEHVPPAVARGLRLRGIDVQTTQEARMLGANDEAQKTCAGGWSSCSNDFSRPARDSNELATTISALNSHHFTTPRVSA